MRQIISIHLGQAGVQIGNSCWQLFCMEHGIKPNGELQGPSSALKEHKGGQNVNWDAAYSDSRPFFYETDNGHLVPRAVFVDLDPSVIDQVRKGEFSQLFSPSNLLSGKQDATIWFRGSDSVGRDMNVACMETIRKLAQNCQSLQGFMIYHSLGGGTGSGFGCKLLEKLPDISQKSTKVSFTVYPSNSIENSILAQYNAVLSTSHLRDNLDATIMFHNPPLYRICSKKLGIEDPSFDKINRLIAHVASSVSSSIRFKGALNSSLYEMCVNLSPYNKMHFLSPSLAPFISADSSLSQKSSVKQITSATFQAENMMVECDPQIGRYATCSMMYRGDVTPKEAVDAISQIKTGKTVNFVDWCPTGFKVGICYQPLRLSSGENYRVLGNVDRSVCSISNTTSVRQSFQILTSGFDKMRCKRAFAFWYVNQGMEQQQFNISRQDLYYLDKDYLEMEAATQ